MISPSKDLNLRIVSPLLRYVRATHGVEACERALAATGLSPDADGAVEGWVSHEQFETVLRHVRSMLKSDQEFLSACSHEAFAGYGVMMYVLRAGTVRSAYGVLARTSHLVSRISRFSIREVGERNAVAIEYRSTKQESRLMCLSRQAQLRLLPQLWPGLPSASLQEESCITRGDDACVYRVAWIEPLRYRWPIGGAAIGLSAAILFETAHQVGALPGLVALPLLGAAIGVAIAYAEAARSTTTFQTETTKLIEDLVKDHQQAVAELRSMNQRERSYTDLLEERVRVRTAQLEDVIKQITTIQEQKSQSLRGLSHDMRSPLQVLTFLAYRLRAREQFDEGEAGRELDESIRRLRDQLGQLAEVATNKPDAFSVRATRIPVDGLADRIKAHLDALLLGRGVSASCFRAREAPDAIMSDATIFDRIVDNIITNAAKYTDRGSIVVEVAGSPGTLSVKVSDTGRGISPDRLEHVFTGTEPDENPAIGDSLGIGLANTVRLLDQVGGRLEVMSRPEVGTTVWIHFPVERDATPVPPSATVAKAPPSEAIQDVVRRIVRIRAAQ